MKLTELLLIATVAAVSLVSVFWVLWLTAVLTFYSVRKVYRVARRRADTVR